MFGVEYLIDKLNTAIASGTLTNLELAQASGAIDMLEKKGVVSVESSIYLPNPVTNKGRFIFVESENRYVFSDGERWDINQIIKQPYFNLLAWGANGTGQLGDNTTITRSSPVSVVGGFTDWVQVSGSNRGLGIRANGSAWAWGCNLSGRLGDNTTTARSSPVSVVGGFTDWVQVAAGYVHSLGVRANGTAWAWGGNTQGRLGDGTTTSKSSPVSVVGGFTDWILVAGASHSLGIRANGSAWGWGFNQYGRLGDGTTTDRSSPVSVVGGFTDWVQVAAGFGHSIGLRANGSAWAWGANGSGQIGDGTTTSKSSPVSVVGGFTDWVQVSGNSHSLGLRANGTAWAWGGNGNGELGDNTATSRLSPVSVIGGFTDWVQVSDGNGFSLGLRG